MAAKCNKEAELELGDDVLYKTVNRQTVNTTEVVYWPVSPSEWYSYTDYKTI